MLGRLFLGLFTCFLVLLGGNQLFQTTTPISLLLWSFTTITSLQIFWWNLNYNSKKDPFSPRFLAEKKTLKLETVTKRGIAKENLSEEVIQAYIDNMEKLLLDKELKEELFPNKKLLLGQELSSNDKKGNLGLDVARIRTITILRRLKGDTERQARILRFLRDTELYEFILKNANLEGANLEKANLRGANLWEADLKEANLEKANLEEAKLWGADLEKANLRGADLEKADLRGANLWEADLKEANLEEANLEGANLEGANLRRANLEGAKLWEANLLRADLEEANLRRANLEKADLRGADLEKANLRGANLKEADLWEANLEEANLEKADLEKATLWEAKLWRANLKKADLRGADLEEADLWSANLEKANFTDAKNLTPKQIKSARFWEKAIYNEEDESENQKYIQELKKDKYFALIFRSISSKYLYLISKLKRIIQSR